MCRKSICLASLALVLGLILASTVQAENIGWWKFDEGSGNTAYDSSGNDHHADVLGTTEWVAGLPGLGGALDFTNTDGANAGDFDPTGGMGVFTIAFWCRWDGTPGIQHFFTKSNGWAADTMMFQVEVKGTHSSPDRIDRFHLAYQGAPQAVLHLVPKNEWAHMAMVFDGTNATGYLNGVDEVGPQPTGIGAPVAGPVLIGVAQPGNRVFQGIIDDMRVYDRVMSQDEIIAIMAGGGEQDLSAYGPDPANKSLHANTWVNLAWKAGPKAVTHDVYLGDNFGDVNDGTGDTFIGNQADLSLLAGFPGFPVSDGLVPGTTYYWRIDEVNDADPNSPWKGDVWSFSIPPKTAYAPDPTDGAEFVDPDVEFTWTGGYGSKLHTVYMGESFEEVDTAVGGMPVGTPRYDPGTLDPEKVLYWRVDEFDGVETHKGDVWSFTTPGAVGNPLPANGAVDVPMTATLGWTAADNASSHEVYFGADADAVRNATTASPEYIGARALGSESYDPGQLDWNAAYYWRVDEVYPGNTVKGLVWSFTTADFVAVDDFESYNDIDPPDAASNRIFDKWVDGFGTTTNGALVGNDLPPYAEQSAVHGGDQSMPYAYDNNMKTSEATKTLVHPRNWTEGGVAKLSLWFRGGSANAAEPMFVALNGNAVVYHDDPEATLSPRWTEWVIDLTRFAEKGVNLANVNTITIGFGAKGAPAAGGAGKIYFDDIRLYR
ncbi:MAG: LamG domain-containing protein [Planctomycetota bacterium]|nr:LamG domain-containing protein [Planctomycetota bacterium]